MSMRKRITDALSPERRQPVDVESESSQAAGEGHSMAQTTNVVDPANPNQAEHYGVSIESMLPQNAERYWRVRRVRHLAPEENQGRHHLFIRVLFAEDGVEEAPIMIEWENGQQELVYSKDQRDPYQTIAMFTWQTCRVSMLDAPSEAVNGLTANHPDELKEDGSRSGNTLFHHSFEIEFEEVIVQSQHSQIFGHVTNGTDLLLQLLSDGNVLGEGAIPNSGDFRFNSVPPGSYVVQVADPETGEVLSQSRVLNLDGTNTAEVNLEVVESEPPVVPTPDPIVAPVEPTISSVEAVAPPVQSVPETPVPTTAETPPPEPPSKDDQVEPGTPVPDVAPLAKSIEHYVLFGPRDHFATRVYLPLLLNQLMEANVTFGFNPEEAVHARRVTILASPDVLPQTLDQTLQQHGIVVQRVHGDLEQIKTAIGIGS